MSKNLTLQVSYALRNHGRQGLGWDSIVLSALSPLPHPQWKL